MTVTEALQARRAIPSFDPSAAISTDEIERLIDLASLAPSSMNLQPWEFLICQSDEDKLRLQSVAMNQKKVSEASAAVVLLGNLDFFRNAEAVADGQISRGYMPAERKGNFLAMASGFEQNRQAAREEAIRSGSLWAMAFMLAAKESGWDTAPMGGFVADSLIAEFELPPTHFPILIICIGKANSEVAVLDRNIRFSAKALAHYGHWEKKL